MWVPISLTDQDKKDRITTHLKGVCDYCGEVSRESYRSSLGPPSPFGAENGNHKNPFDCIRALKERMNLMDTRHK